MEPGNILTDVEELTRCGFCNQQFNESDLIPKILSCRHHFCLKCIQGIMIRGQDIICVSCWKQTEVTNGSPSSLQTYNAVVTLARHLNELRLEKCQKKDSKMATQILSANHLHTSSSSPFSLLINRNGEAQQNEVCITHSIPQTLWCHSCQTILCQLCVSQEHNGSGHVVHLIEEACNRMTHETEDEMAALSKLLMEIRHLEMKQRQFLLCVLDACTTLKTLVETELQNDWSSMPDILSAQEALSQVRATISRVDKPTEASSLLATVTSERLKLQAKCHEMFLQCQLDNLISNSAVMFDFQLFKQILSAINRKEPIPASLFSNNGLNIDNSTQRNPFLFLANYCMSQLYSRHVMTKTPQHVNGNGLNQHSSSTLTSTLTTVSHTNGHSMSTMTHSNGHAVPSVTLSNGPTLPQGTLTRGMSPQPPQSSATLLPALTSNSNPCLDRLPRYYFDVDISGLHSGRIVIEIRPDVAPKMSTNFAKLCIGDKGYGYRGCQVFQCWGGQSLITGDFELNNGRGGRGIYDKGFFQPDETNLPAVRGAVGMRRMQKHHENFGMVGSQFRIVLQEMQGFTGIFGHIVEGIELAEKIASFGDKTGKPQKVVIISDCGQL